MNKGTTLGANISPETLPDSWTGEWTDTAGRLCRGTLRNHARHSLMTEVREADKAREEVGKPFISHAVGAPPICLSFFDMSLRRYKGLVDQPPDLLDSEDETSCEAYERERAYLHDTSVEQQRLWDTRAERDRSAAEGRDARKKHAGAWSARRRAVVERDLAKVRELPLPPSTAPSTPSPCTAHPQLLNSLRSLEFRGPSRLLTGYREHHDSRMRSNGTDGSWGRRRRKGKAPGLGTASYRSEQKRRERTAKALALEASENASIARADQSLQHARHRTKQARTSLQSATALQAACTEEATEAHTCMLEEYSDKYMCWAQATLLGAAAKRDTDIELYEQMDSAGQLFTVDSLKLKRLKRNCLILDALNRFFTASLAVDGDRRRGQFVAYRLGGRLAEGWGRHYALGGYVDLAGEWRSISLQGCQKELRLLLAHTFCHDLDFVNSLPVIASQLHLLGLCPEEHLSLLKEYCRDRAEWFGRIIDHHRIPPKTGLDDSAHFNNPPLLFFCFACLLRLSRPLSFPLFLLSFSLPSSSSSLLHPLLLSLQHDRSQHINADGECRQHDLCFRRRKY